MDEIIAGKYRVLEKLVQGGMGTVYKALQTDVQRIVALKILSQQLAKDPEFHRRFRQEALIIAQLSHPNIVNVIGIEPYEESLCIVMEFLEGRSLQNLIEQKGRLSPKRTLGIACQVAKALHYAHGKGIIHRDIKPENIMIGKNDELKVTDFGIARWEQSSLKTQTGMMMGTPKFMSPEQARGKKIDHRSDIYSLGLLLYYMLTGRLAYDARNAVDVALLQQFPPAPVSSLVPDIPPALEKLIEKAINLDPGKRFSTASQMAEKLESIMKTMENPPDFTGEEFPPSAVPGEPTQIKKDKRFELPGQEPEIAQELPATKSRRTSVSLILLIALFLFSLVVLSLWLGNTLIQSLNKPDEPSHAPVPTSTPASTPLIPSPTPMQDAQYFYDKAVLLAVTPGSDPEDCRENFEKSLNLDGEYYPALRDFGYFLFDQKEYTKARAMLKKALEFCDDEKDRKLIQNRLALIHQQTTP